MSLSRNITGNQGAASFAGWADQANGVNRLHAVLQAGAYAVSLGGASASVAVTYKDTLHFDSSGTFRFAIHLEDNIQAGNPNYSISDANVSVTQLDGGIFFGHDLRTFDQPSVSLHRYDAFADILVSAGTVQTVELQMSAVAGANAWLDGNGDLQSASTSLDAADTGYMTITPLDGGTFHADSGATYQLIPESGERTIFGLGLVAMILRQRRRRSGNALFGR